MAHDFDAEQKRYLEGFSHGIAAVRMTGGLAAGGAATAAPSERPGRTRSTSRPRTARSRRAASSPSRRSGSGPRTRSRATTASSPRRRPARRPSPRTISAGAITACSGSPRPRIPTCAACASPMASCTTGSSPASPTSPTPMAAATATSPPGQPPGARDRPRARPAVPRRTDRSRAHRPGGGGRQHPQRHRLAHRRHRRPGTARHEAPGEVLAQLDPQRPLAVRAAAQVQRRLRRRRRDAGARGDQRRRLPGDRGAGGRRRRAGRVDAPRARRHLRPPRPRPRHRRGPAPRRLQRGRRRDHPGVHRERRPHQPQQVADEVRPRRLGLRQVPRRRRGEARAQARPGRPRARRAAQAHRPLRPCRGPQAGPARPELDRRGAAGRQDDHRPDAGAGRGLPRVRRRPDPPHRVAELPVLRRARREGGRGRGAGRRPRADHAGVEHPRRPRRLHRQPRLQVRRLGHQGPRPQDRRPRRGDGDRARRAGERPPHRLPPFLRPSTTSATSG